MEPELNSCELFRELKFALPFSFNFLRQTLQTIFVMQICGAVRGFSNYTENTYYTCNLHSARVELANKTMHPDTHDRRGDYLACA